jgi:hypothetical protein
MDQNRRNSFHCRPRRRAWPRHAAALSVRCASDRHRDAHDTGGQSHKSRRGRLAAELRDSSTFPRERSQPTKLHRSSLSQIQAGKNLTRNPGPVAHLREKREPLRRDRQSVGSLEGAAVIARSGAVEVHALQNTQQPQDDENDEQ